MASLLSSELEFEPVKKPPARIPYQSRLLQSVRGSWIDHHFHRTALSLQSVIEFFALRQRNTYIFLSMEDKGRSLHSFDIEHDRLPAVRSGFVPEFPRKVIRKD